MFPPNLFPLSTGCWCKSRKGKIGAHEGRAFNGRKSNYEKSKFQKQVGGVVVGGKVRHLYLVIANKLKMEENRKCAKWVSSLILTGWKGWQGVCVTWGSVIEDPVGRLRKTEVTNRFFFVNPIPGRFQSGECIWLLCRTTQFTSPSANLLLSLTREKLVWRRWARHSQRAGSFN